MNNRILVTGGAGFIGSAVARHIINDTPDDVCVVDKLTYAGNLENLASIAKSGRFRFEKVDICDKNELDRVFADFKPTHVMHLAAESHVDRSIDGPGEFIQTNIVGTYTLLEAARKYFHTLDDEAKDAFRFHHISTDEVYGDLNGPNDFFRETTPYAPSSPYSASKASSDHLVRAWRRTFGLPTIVTNCSNNYGPYHFPEKLIPLIILHALDGKELPVYGEGLQIRASPWPLITRDPGSALSPGSPSPGTSSLLSAREAVPSVRPTPRSGFLPPVFVMESEISSPLVLHVGARGKGSPAGSRRCVCVVGDGVPAFSF